MDISQDPVRLQQWLRNMGRENWTPSRHQYICHEHFAPSCFKVRWGIRYLEGDAVPTVFQEAQTVDDLSNGGEDTEVVVMSECTSGESQDEFVNGIAAAILTQGHGLVANESTLDCTDEVVASLGVEDVNCTTEEFLDVHEGQETQVIAYFETIPNVFPCETSTQFTFSPDTVLSSALSSKPIPSTLPIVSKHVPPSQTSLVLTVERLDTDGELDDSKSDEDSLERPDHQLEEHW
ncbi:hypothetical protein INR49_021283 [Caranx melampygus]|nr:hypothetical protein INR49_021283 [Caranx melampygus]